MWTLGCLGQIDATLRPAWKHSHCSERQNVRGTPSLVYNTQLHAGLCGQYSNIQFGFQDDTIDAIWQEQCLWSLFLIINLQLSVLFHFWLLKSCVSCLYTTSFSFSLSWLWPISAENNFNNNINGWERSEDAAQEEWVFEAFRDFCRLTATSQVLSFLVHTHKSTANWKIQD